MAFQWKLEELMVARGMRHSTDLHEALVDRGFDISSAQVYRVVTRMPERLNLQLIAEICNILDCTISDVLGSAPRTNLRAVTQFDPSRAAFQAARDIAENPSSTPLDIALSCGLIALVEEAEQISSDLEEMQGALAELVRRGTRVGSPS